MLMNMRIANDDDNESDQERSGLFIDGYWIDLSDDEYYSD